MNEVGKVGFGDRWIFAEVDGTGVGLVDEGAGGGLAIGPLMEGAP